MTNSFVERNSGFVIGICPKSMSSPEQCSGEDI